MIMIPIMSELVYSSAAFNRPVVIATYVPFAVFPALIALKTLAVDRVLSRANVVGKTD